MLEQGKGSIINTASFVAVMGAATSQISYSASKGGVLSMSRELGVQFARQGVRVNALCPGPVNTPLLRELFAADDQRGSRYTLEAAGLYLDYSKNRIDDQTLSLLSALATECGLTGRIAAMFRGDAINTTEKRSVLHVALRKPAGETLVVDGVEVVAEVHAVLARMATFSAAVRSGHWLGHTGQRIRNIISIGIGGSDLGPVMAYEALRHYSQRWSRRPAI